MTSRVIKAALIAVVGVAACSGSAMAQCSAYPYTLTNGTNADASQVMANFNYVLNCAKGLAAQPQGRLTLVSGAPVMSASQSGATTIYYTPYVGNDVPIYNGTAMVPTAFSELSNITTNAASGNAGPTAVAANKNYDLFVWSNAGTVTLTRGPAWTNDTTRSAGTNLQRINGIWTNQTAITNGPAANLGTYVGTVRSDGSSQIDFVFGGIGTGGVAAVLGVWNAYNRVGVRGLVGDSTATWTYSTAAWRAANNSSTMRVSLVAGLAEDFASASYAAMALNSTTDYAMAGIGYDTTTAMSGRSVEATSYTNTTVANPTGDFSVQPLGFHYLQAIEYAFGSGGTMSWIGPSGTPTFRQPGLLYSWMY